MQTLESDGRDLRDALDLLGATIEEIARSLASGGITGRPLNGRHCPIARYLLAAVPAIDSISVGFSEIEASGWNWDTVQIRLGEDDPVALFIDAFDSDPDAYALLVDRDQQPQP